MTKEAKTSQVGFAFVTIARMVASVDTLFGVPNITVAVTYQGLLAFSLYYNFQPLLQVFLHGPYGLSQPRSYD